MKKKRNMLAMLAACLIGAGTASAMETSVTLADQGSFFVGGKIVTAPGVYKDAEPTNFDGETLHGDAAYVRFEQSRCRGSDGTMDAKKRVGEIGGRRE